MATAIRTFTRTALRSSFRPTTATRTPVNQFTRQSFRQQWQRRGYADSASPKTGRSINSSIFWLLGLGTVGGGGYYYYSQNEELFGGKEQSTKVFTPKFEDYKNVYNAIANSLQEHDEYEDGSYGPVVLRLAWHASGTYVQPSAHHVQTKRYANRCPADTTKPPTPAAPTARPCVSPPNPNTAPMPAS